MNVTGIQHASIPRRSRGVRAAAGARATVAIASTLSALSCLAAAAAQTQSEGDVTVTSLEQAAERVDRGPGGPITFAVVGDVPYSDDEIPVFQQHLADLNRYSNAQFFIHVGDIIAGSDSCPEARYSRMADWLKTLAMPAFIIPGDNEWVDCPDPDAAWIFWTSHLLRLEENFCCLPHVERQAIRPENFAFVEDGVLFVGLNVVSGSPDAPMRDGADWVRQQFRAKRPVVRAAVVFTQAGPSSSRTLFFDPFVAEAGLFQKPVLLVHGDGHSWQYESPYAQPNMVRIQVARGTDPPVRLTVTTDPAAPFTYVRTAWPTGTPLVNHPPCAKAGPNQTVPATRTAYLTGVANDDGRPSPLAVAWTQIAGPGAATFASAGSAGTTATFSAMGTYLLQFDAFDGLYTQRDTVQVVAADPATVPLATDDSYALDEDVALAVAAPGVLANDRAGLRLPLAAAVFAAPVHGTLLLTADGGLTYTPDSNWFGTDSFLYRVSDPDEAADIGTVTLTVRPLNDVPVVASDAYSVQVGQILEQAPPGVLGNDVDADGDLLMATLVTSPAHGSLLFHSDGSFTYTPVVDYIGTDSFTYAASDGQSGAEATVTISVQPVVLTYYPTADAHVRSSNPSSNYGTLSRLRVETDNTTYHSYLKFTVSGVGGSVRRARLRLRMVTTGPDPGSAHFVSNNYQGTTTAWTEAGLTWSNAPAIDTPAVDEGTVVTGNWVEWDVTGGFTGNGTYTLALQSASTAAVEYSSKEGSYKPELVVETDLPNSPPVGVDDAYAVDEDQQLDVPAPGVLANDTDDPQDVLTATLLTPPASGALVLDASGAFRYTPAPNFHGGIAFTYTVQDGRGGSGTAQAAITVTSVNDAPVAAGDAYTASEDVALAVSGPGVLANDADVEGDTLSAALASPAAHGVVTLQPDGSFTYTPQSDFYGSDSFTYTASDGHGGSANGTVALTVGAVNDAPVAAGDAYTVTEDTPLAVPAPGVLANDTDVDGDSLTATVGTNPAHGTLVLDPVGSFTYTPNPNYFGNDGFTYTVSDGHGGGATAGVGITVAPVSDPPVAVGDAYETDEGGVLRVPAPGVLAHDTDPDGEALTAALLTGPTSGTLVLNADGSLEYTPGTNFAGTDSFTYAASDSTGGTATGTVTLTVHAVNSAPNAVADTYTTDEDTNLVVAPPGVLGNDADPDGDALTAAVLSGPASGTLLLNADGSFTYTPATDFHGADGFAYTVSDWNGASATGSVTITIAAVNDAPLAVDDAYTAVTDSTLVVGAPGVLTNDVDLDGDALTASIASNPVNGTLDLNPDGGFSYVPSSGFSGTDTFVYTLSDGKGGTGTGTTVVSVVPLSLSVSLASPGGTGGEPLAPELAVRAAPNRAGSSPARQREAGAGNEAGSSSKASETVNVSAHTLDSQRFLPHPNPFTGTTTIAYELTRSAHVELEIYDVRGRRIRELLDGVQAPGPRIATWDGCTDSGVRVDSGVYFVHLRIAGRVVTRRVLLLRR